MSNTFEEYKNLSINSELISLTQPDSIAPFFCYPINSTPIGFEGSIMYCFIDGYGEMVFASNPESCADKYVYPLAASFEDFIRLILACGSANPIEQIIWMSKEQFEQHLCEEQKVQTEQQKELLLLLERELHLTPMEQPFEYVKALQVNFDESKIQYRDDYYDILGI